MDNETARTIGNILGFLLIAWLVWRATDETHDARLWRWFPWSPIKYRSDSEQER